MPAARPQHEDGGSGQPRGVADEARLGSEHEPPAAASTQPPRPSRKSQRGLDWFVFFLADTQMGFGPLVAVYLTAQKWTQVDIGLVLTAGGLVALAGQIPGGAVVDAVRSERVLAAWAVAAIGVSALLIGAWPIFVAVLAAKLLHSAASCILGPAIAAISLGLVGHAGISERLGRNARYAAAGAGLAAVGMGAAGYLFSNRSIFFVTAALCIPTMLSLWLIGAGQVDPERAHGGKATPHPGDPMANIRNVMRDRALMIFAGCIALFHLANAAMLPLTASVVTMRSDDWAVALVGACMLVPQLVVVAFAPWIGREAVRIGRRPLLLLGFGALTLRGVLLAFASNPYMLVAVQILDGISAAALAVMVPLIIADVTRGTGHFNLAQGTVGTAVGIGASFSTLLAGYTYDHFGLVPAFLSLAGLAGIGFIAVLAFMPETGASPGESNEFRRGALFPNPSRVHQRR